MGPNRRKWCTQFGVLLGLVTEELSELELEVAYLWKQLLIAVLCQSAHSLTLLCSLNGHLNDVPKMSSSKRYGNRYIFMGHCHSQFGCEEVPCCAILSFMTNDMQ